MGRPSWHPGYYGIEVGEKTATALAAVADVMIPGDGSYPSAGEAHVVDFVQARVNPAEHEALERLMAGVDPKDPAAIAAWLTRLEEDDPPSLELLRFLVYTAYYRDEAVVRAINRRGYDYHAAPMPYGYDVPEDIPLPDGSRGGYTPTTEVRRVEL
jgi:hypothetical protein